MTVVCVAYGQPSSSGPEVRNIHELRIQDSEGSFDSQEPLGEIDPIVYHGGPVLLGTVNAYFVWYGNWHRNGTPYIFNDWIQAIGGSPYFNINTTYFDSSGEHVSGSVAFAGSTFDRYSHGLDLTSSDVGGVVADAMSSGALPTDENGVYLVMTSPDVSQSAFCQAYCGWHGRMPYRESDIKVAFVGGSNRCPGACARQRVVSPNDNVEADGMINIATHELEEAITDPDLNAWYDSRRLENGDKCAWQFGETYMLPNGSLANMRLGGRHFYIQQNWVNDGLGYCALALPAALGRQ